MKRQRPGHLIRWLAHRKRRRGSPAGPAGSAALAELVAGLANGDAGAFAALYDYTCARLYGVALRVLRDPTSAQEATKEAYLQAWATIDSFDPAKGSAEAWLTTLTHRVAVDRLRAEPCHAPRILGCSNSDALNDWERETIALVYYGALTYQDVAEFLGVPLPTVTSHIRAGLTRLTQSAGTA